MRCHLGVCLDTCHSALQFEDPLESLRAYRDEGIRISKIQLSAALGCTGAARRLGRRSSLSPNRSICIR